MIIEIYNLRDDFKEYFKINLIQMMVLGIELEAGLGSGATPSSAWELSNLMLGISFLSTQKITRYWELNPWLQYQKACCLVLDAVFLALDGYVLILSLDFASREFPADCIFQTHIFDCCLDLIWLIDVFRRLVNRRKKGISFFSPLFHLSEKSPKFTTSIL